MIVVSDFSKNYRSVTAADHISFTARAGKITALVGPNGAGKTTILRAVCGLQAPSSGSVIVDDSNGRVKKMQTRSYDSAVHPEQVRSLVGIVPEQPLLYGDFTVAEFLVAVARMYGLSEQSIPSRLSETSEQCALVPVRDKKIHTLSKGYRQRLSFAQALIHDPPNIVLDEPASGLDPAQITQMRTLLQKLSQTKTVLISTHLMQEIDALDPYILILSRGCIVAEGSAAEIARTQHTATFEAAYLSVMGGSDE